MSTVSFDGREGGSADVLVGLFAGFGVERPLENDLRLGSQGFGGKTHLIDDESVIKNTNRQKMMKVALLILGLHHGARCWLCGTRKLNREGCGFKAHVDIADPVPESIHVYLTKEYSLIGQ